MSQTSCIDLSLTELAAKLAAKELTCTQAVTACFERIEATESKLDALLAVHREAALSRAAELDAAGPNPAMPLWGVPLTIKDAICVAGHKNTCGSKILENFSPFYDATAVAKLKAAGAVIIGKANLDEFAMGSSTENSAYKTTKNPWNTAKVPGGSSGGSAASVAARQCFGSLGTDTGGSIRQPASFCGIVGLKPTYGRVSRYGLVAYGSSLDQIGPMTRSVADCATLLSVIAGHDPKDSTSAPVPVPDYLAVLGKKDMQGVTLGLPEEYFGEGLDPEVAESIEAALDVARSLGAKTVPVRLPHTKYAVATYYIVAMAEASSNLARFDGVRYGHRCDKPVDLADLYLRSRTEGFGQEVQRRIMLGTYVLSAGYYDAYYKKAAQVRRLIRQDFLDAFATCDLVVGPAAPFTAFGIAEKTDDPLQMYLSDIFTISLNLAGLPGLSLPVGLGARTKMPVGLQFFGPAFGEESILSAAHTLEQHLSPIGAPTV